MAESPEAIFPPRRLRSHFAIPRGGRIYRSLVHVSIDHVSLIWRMTTNRYFTCSRDHLVSGLEDFVLIASQATQIRGLLLVLPLSVRPVS